MIINRTTRSRQARPGVAAVELAVCTMVLVVLMLGLWETGRLIQVRQIVSNAAREGGRQAATGLKSTAEVQHYIRQSMERAGLNLAGMPGPEITNLTSPSRNDPRDAVQLDLYHVRVSMPAANFRWVLFRFTNTYLVAESVWASQVDTPVGQPSEDIPD
jgi:Flp pilus assembly protein TadG